MEDMSYPSCCSFFAPDWPGAYRVVYVAKILGSNPQYVFERQFVDLHAKNKDGGRLYWFELDEYDVYESASNGTVIAPKKAICLSLVSGHGSW